VAELADAHDSKAVLKIRNSLPTSQKAKQAFSSCPSVALKSALPGAQEPSWANLALWKLTAKAGSVFSPIFL
jgi:hypothetical protein